MVGTELTPSGLSWNLVKITFGVLNLYLGSFSLSNTCCIRSRKLWRFSSWAFSASSCVIPHPYLRTRSAMFSYRDFSFLPGLPAFSLDISRSHWRLAKAVVSASTCQEEYGRLWLSLISDLMYVGEARYRICYHKIICTVELWQNVLKTGNLLLFTWLLLWTNHESSNIGSTTHDQRRDFSILLLITYTVVKLLHT